MKIQILGTGSSGNSTVITDGNTKIVLDCGLSLKQELLRSKIDLSDVNAIFISHAHTDHSHYILDILKYSNATLYIHKETFMELKDAYRFNFNGVKVQFIENDKKYLIENICVFTMKLSHDCKNCNGFIFVSQNDYSSFAYISDTGIVPTLYLDLLKKVDAMAIEANHDIEMLNESKRPRFLKDRILSYSGHLSNIACGEFLDKIIQNGKLKQVFLVHLSRECNEEKLAIDTILDLINSDRLPRFYISKQDEALEVIEVCHEN